jgi:hypothetical protein
MVQTVGATHPPPAPVGPDSADAPPTGRGQTIHLVGWGVLSLRCGYACKDLEEAPQDQSAD